MMVIAGIGLGWVGLGWVGLGQGGTRAGDCRPPCPCTALVPNPALSRSKAERTGMAPWATPER